MPRSKNNDGDPSSYRELNQRLDEVIDKLQDPSVDVDEAVGYYEEAIVLIEKLNRHLEGAQNKIREISARFSKAKE
jgi:exodeoxyribonuclease VII small subunit